MVHRPVLLRCQTNAAPLAPPRLSLPRKLAAGLDRVHQLRHARARRPSPGPSSGPRLAAINQRVIYRQALGLAASALQRAPAQVAGAWAHVAMGQQTRHGQRHRRTRPGSGWKRRAIFSKAGSKRNDRSAVVIIGRCFLLRSWASGIRCSGLQSAGVHWWAPARLLVSTHSLPNNTSK